MEKAEEIRPNEVSGAVRQPICTYNPMNGQSITA